jgi:phospholipase A-2-activating protein
VHTLTGHTSFIYQLAVLPSGDLVSSSEDRSVRVWKGASFGIKCLVHPNESADGECAQVLVHPAISVWTVSTLPNGDIVSGSSDKMVRIFSASEERWAPAEEIKAYDDVVAQQSLASHDVGQIKVESMDALNTPGAFVTQAPWPCINSSVRQESWPNQTGIERRCNRSIQRAFFVLPVNSLIPTTTQWDGSVWQRIGERAEGPSGSGPTKTFFEGKEYDYVWNVAIEDGEPALKLPYNVAGAYTESSLPA